MEGLIGGTKRTYDEFKKQISPDVTPLFDELYHYCFSLGKNVVEDIRMHRIVFSKSISFRNFIDIEPQRDFIILKIKRDRKEPENEIQLRPNDNLDEIKKVIFDAYTNIH